MRYSTSIYVALALLCAACSDGTQATHDHRWFNTYQTDRTCQAGRPFVHDEDIKGPTGRAHPF